MSFTRRPGSGHPRQTKSSRRPPHRKKCTRTANCFIAHHPGTGRTFTRGPCVFSNHTKAPSLRAFGIAAPITWATLDAPIDAFVWSGAAHGETGLQRNGTRSSLATRIHIQSQQ
ncbi:uncharacterized protein TNCV_22091 [Trichonephila clavipes]|nr:uncharacterized protein TNCV_22091 [Trichonephila clavipes]